MTEATEQAHVHAYRGKALNKVKEASQGVEQDFSSCFGIAAKAKQGLVLLKFLLQLASANQPP